MDIYKCIVVAEQDTIIYIYILKDISILSL